MPPIVFVEAPSQRAGADADADRFGSGLTPDASVPMKLFRIELAVAPA